MYPYEMSYAVLRGDAALVRHVWQLCGSLEILLCAMLERVAGCRKAWLGTLEALAYENGRGAMYDIGTWTATSVKKDTKASELVECGTNVISRLGDLQCPLYCLYTCRLETKSNIQKEPFQPVTSTSLPLAHLTLSLWSHPDIWCHQSQCGANALTQR